MARLVGEAILLRAVDFGESDRIAHLLTPERGRLTVIAKGARRSVKRFPGTLDLFNHLRVHVEQRRRSAMARLEQATLVRPFLALRRRPEGFFLACYLAELLDRLAPEGGPRSDTRRLFAYALQALDAIEHGTADVRLRLWLELRALDALGLRPELRCCVRCGREVGDVARVVFHVGEGGVVCGPCSQRVEGGLPVHLGTLRALESALDFDLDRLERLALGRAALQEASALVGRFKRFHVGVALRSERILDAVMPVMPVAGPAAPGARP